MILPVHRMVVVVVVVILPWWPAICVQGYLRRDSGISLVSALIVPHDVWLDLRWTQQTIARLI